MRKLMSFILVVLTLRAVAAPTNPDLSKLLEDEKNSIQIYKKSVSSVVNVTNIQTGQSWMYGAVDVPAGAGSGYVWDNEGHIVTNYHVIEKGDNFTINFLNDNKPYKAKVIGAEPKKDIAVLQLLEKPKSLTPISIGSSSELMVGQKTIAIGNPFALDHTMTVGIVSAIDRKILGIGGVKIHGMIQTDAAINPGNSGGPLLNSSGEMIGMNTMIFSSSGASSGLGFAVPVDTIKSIVPQLIQFGKVTRPGLGIGVVPDDVKNRFLGEKGVAISYIVEKGPAEKAGLQGIRQDRFGNMYLGDVIISVDNVEVNSMDDIFQVMEKYKIGETVTLKYKRKNKVESVKIKLDSV
ncbi:MAG: S1C family serine protease [Bacteriovoracaceae bacterium]